MKNIQKYTPNKIIEKISSLALPPDKFFLEKNVNFNNQLRRKIFSKDILCELGENLNSPENHIYTIFDSYNGSFKGKIGNCSSNGVADPALTMRIRVTRFFGLKYITPFLDKELTEFCLSEIHPELKIKNDIKKYILKKVAKKHLPPELPIERKRGFSTPTMWFRNEWWNYTREKILDIKDEFINKKVVEDILRKHKNKYSVQNRKIFSLLMFKLWEEENLV